MLKLCGKIFYRPCTIIFHKSSAMTKYCPSVMKLVLFDMYIPVKCKMWNLVLWFNPWEHEDNNIVNVIHQIQKSPKMIYLMKILCLKSNALCKRSYIWTFGHESLGRWNPKHPFIIDIVEDLETVYFNDDNLFPIKKI